MICFLCCELSKFTESAVVFERPKWNEEFQIVEIIKCFGIEVHAEDAVLNKLCNSCWKHLDDFHRFWRNIKEKQKLFQELSNIKCDPLGDDFKDESSCKTDYLKDVQLHELSMDEPSFVKAELSAEELSGPNNDDLISHDRTDDDSDYLPSSATKHCLALKIKRSEKKGKVISVKQLKTGDNAELICKVCYKESKNKTALQKHMYKCHPLELRKLRLAKEIKKVDNDTKPKCRVCGKESVNKYALKRHMYRSHPLEEELKFSCNLCVQKFAKQYLLDQHINRHGVDENRKTCQTCKKRFFSRKELQVHRKAEHAEELKIVCDSCGKSFKSKVGYEYHYQNEHLTTQPEAQCLICKEWMKNHITLNEHMYKHQDENSDAEFVCNICGAVKSTRRKLNCHKRYNHPRKMHQCKICNKEFKRVLALEEHIAAAHTGQPLYTCCFCPQTFKSNANMYSHRRRLHPTECKQQNISAARKGYDRTNAVSEVE